MTCNTRLRLALVALALGVAAGLPASAAAEDVAGAAAKPKAKTRVTLVATPFLLPTLTDEVDASASCAVGTTLISGGALSNTPAPAGPPFLFAEVLKSGPSGNAWFVRYENDASVDLLPSVQAICLKDRLKVKGADGKPRAVSKVTQVNTPFTLPPNVAATNFGRAQFDVACPAGTKIAGGGASFTAIDLEAEIQLMESGPQGNGWRVRYDNDEGVAQTAVASALCLKSKLKVKGLPGNDKARSKFEQVEQGVALPPQDTNNGRARSTVACPVGATIVGGGAKISSATPLATTDIEIEESGAQGNGWQVTLDNNDAVAQSATVHALCLRNKLKVK